MIEKRSTVSSNETRQYEVESGARVSETVVEAVSAASNLDPAAMDPLAESVDPDALDALFADRYDGTPRLGGVVRFSFSGYDVTVTDGRLVSVSSATQ
ncbi:hypothetical protein NGM10_12940 [Halorussus salilacus]|uniref:HalOD1 output domain-containing protein n=1 Tax=Halorussus salilacus TaxID=2953750 RepID=UPI00209F3EA1|nr:HalOD1 output domain-containing protein [Halorussus salilacus]USZ67629.1 hypothetical protein NGM10_12940 [Halorussus salilacus]